MVHMKTKVMRFPQPRHGATEVPATIDDPLLAGTPALCHPVDCYRVKCKTGGSDLDAEAAPEEEEAALDLDLNVQPLPLEACLVTGARPDSSRGPDELRR